MADLKGAGVVTHIWLTVADNEFGWPRLLRIRVYYDGYKTPSVDAPLGDFFRRGPRLGAQPELDHGARQFVRPRAQQLLAHALSQVVPHHGDQRRQPPGADVLLPRGLPEICFVARRYRLLSCLLPAGTSGAQRSQLRIPQHQGNRTLCRHGDERGADTGFMVRRRRRSVLCGWRHPSRKSSAPAAKTISTMPGACAIPTAHGRARLLPKASGWARA